PARRGAARPAGRPRAGPPRAAPAPRRGHLPRPRRSRRARSRRRRLHLGPARGRDRRAARRSRTSVRTTRRPPEARVAALGSRTLPSRTIVSGGNVGSVRWIFLGTGGFVGRIESETRIAFWPDEPSDHGFDPSLLITVDLARTPTAAALGEISVDAVEVDDCFSGPNGDVRGTTIGPR